MTEAWPTGSFDVLQKDLVVVFCGLKPRAFLGDMVSMPLSYRILG
jgi:hypothetical protein